MHLSFVIFFLITLNPFIFHSDPNEYIKVDTNLHDYRPGTNRIHREDAEGNIQIFNILQAKKGSSNVKYFCRGD